MSITVGTDSYVSIADAQTILDDYFDTDNWDSASTDTKEKALKQATRNIDTLYLRFERYDDSQALAFPRSQVMEYLNETVGEIPEIVEKATTIEALKILDDRASADTITTLKQQGIKSQSVEGTSFTLDSLAVQKELNKEDSLKSKDARLIINPYIEKMFVRR